MRGHFGIVALTSVFILVLATAFPQTVYSAGTAPTVLLRGHLSSAAATRTTRAPLADFGAAEKEERGDGEEEENDSNGEWHESYRMTVFEDDLHHLAGESSVTSVDELIVDDLATKPSDDPAAILSSETSAVPSGSVAGGLAGPVVSGKGNTAISSSDFRETFLATSNMQLDDVEGGGVLSSASADARNSAHEDDAEVQFAQLVDSSASLPGISGVGGEATGMSVDDAQNQFFGLVAVQAIDGDNYDDGDDDDVDDEDEGERGAVATEGYVMHSAAKSASAIVDYQEEILSPTRTATSTVALTGYAEGVGGAGLNDHRSLEIYPEQRELDGKGIGDEIDDSNEDSDDDDEEEDDDDESDDEGGTPLPSSTTTVFQLTDFPPPSSMTAVAPPPAGAPTAVIAGAVAGSVAVAGMAAGGVFGIVSMASAGSAAAASAAETAASAAETAASAADAAAGNAASNGGANAGETAGGMLGVDGSTITQTTSYGGFGEGITVESGGTPVEEYLTPSWDLISTAADLRSVVIDEKRRRKEESGSTSAAQGSLQRPPTAVFEEW